MKIFIKKLNLLNLRSLALGKFKAPPISNLIENLTKNIALIDVQASFGQIMLNTDMGQSIIDIGKNFIPTDSSPLGKNF